jgi:hypothetical protein
MEWCEESCAFYGFRQECVCGGGGDFIPVYHFCGMKGLYNIRCRRVESELGNYLIVVSQSLDANLGNYLS